MNHFVKTVQNLTSPNNLESIYLTIALLHAIYNVWLAAATASKSQSTACDINIGLDMP